jgi:hypothetical protein
VNASLFTKYGEVFCLHAASEYMRLSLSAQRIVRPRSIIEALAGSETARSSALEHSSESDPAASCQSEEPVAPAVR